jgi:hypothetical protein
MSSIPGLGDCDEQSIAAFGHHCRFCAGRMHDALHGRDGATDKGRKGYLLSGRAARHPGERSGRAPEPNDIGGAPGLHGLEQIAGEDRLMLAAMHFTSIDDLADVKPVLEAATSFLVVAHAANLIADLGIERSLLQRLV